MDSGAPPPSYEQAIQIMAFQPVFVPVCGQCGCTTNMQCGQCGMYLCYSHLKLYSMDQAADRNLCENCYIKLHQTSTKVHSRRKMAIRGFAGVSIIIIIIMVVRVSFTFD